MDDDTRTDNLQGLIPESWYCCVDCGMNTAPGCFNRADMEAAIAALGDKWHNNEQGVTQTIDDRSEVYTVREAIWLKAGWSRWPGACASAVWKNASAAD